MTAAHAGYPSTVFVCIEEGKFKLVLSNTFAHLSIANFLRYHLLHVTEFLGLLVDLRHDVVQVRKYLDAFAARARVGFHDPRRLEVGAIMARDSELFRGNMSWH